MAENTWTVGVGLDKGAYRTVLTTNRFSQAIRTYDSYNVHSGGKKRLLRNGTLIHRVITNKTVERVYRNETLFPLPIEKGQS